MSPNKTLNSAGKYSSPSAVSSISSLSMLTPLLESFSLATVPQSKIPTNVTVSNKKSRYDSRRSHHHHKSSEFLTDCVVSKPHHRHSHEHHDKSCRSSHHHRGISCKPLGEDSGGGEVASSLCDSQVKGDGQQHLKTSAKTTSCRCKHKRSEDHQQHHHSHNHLDHQNQCSQNTGGEQTIAEDGEASDLTLTSKLLDSTTVHSLHRSKNSFTNRASKQALDGDHALSPIYYQSQEKQNANDVCSVF